MLVPVMPDSSTSCVSVLDDAIDHENSAKEGGSLTYAARQISEPGSWRELLKFKDGASPTEFVIGVVPPSELMRIEDECHAGRETERVRELYWRCFLHGVRDIKNGPQSASEVIPRKSVHGVEYVEPTWLASKFCGRLRLVALEVGRAVWMWNSLGDVAIKN